MTRKENVLVRHRDEIKQAAANRRAVSIALVGSVARGEDTADSDYDFLAEFAPKTGLFTVAGLRHDLETILGEKVDLVTRRSLADHCSSMVEDAIVL